MRRFQFKLDPALRMRRRLEEQAEAEHADLQRRLTAEQTRREELHRDLECHHASRSRLQQMPRVDVEALVDADRYGDALSQALEEQTERVDEASAAAEAGRALLRQRHIEREVLDRLRSRRQEEHRREELRVEQQFLDETSVQRWRRR